MSNFKLNLPTDVPWKRKCVSQDMIDTTPCDQKLPYRWRSSIAPARWVLDSWRVYAEAGFAFALRRFLICFFLGLISILEEPTLISFFGAGSGSRY